MGTPTKSILLRSTSEYRFEPDLTVFKINFWPVSRSIHSKPDMLWSCCPHCVKTHHFVENEGHRVYCPQCEGES